MPLYEYECDDCGHRFERIRKFSDPPLTTCPECNGPIRKLLSPPAIQFKGTGWYVTDYARKSGGKPAEDAGEARKDARSANGSHEKPSGAGKSSSDGKSGDGPSGGKPGSESNSSGARAASRSGNDAKPSGSASSSTSSSAPG